MQRLNDASYSTRLWIPRKYRNGNGPWATEAALRCVGCVCLATRAQAAHRSTPAHDYITEAITEVAIWEIRSSVKAL